MDIESLKYVAEDLSFSSTWNGDMASEEIRRGSATLRRLLVEETYSTALRACGFEKEPKLIAIAWENMMSKEDTSLLEVALAGGVNTNGIDIALQVIFKNVSADWSPPISPNPQSLRENGYPGEKIYNLSEYLKSPSGFVNGIPFSRRDVIKYIANVKGGVHLNPKQRKQEEKLVARIGKIDKRISIFGTDGLLVELVAIAKSIGDSDDAKRFISCGKF